MSTKGAGLAQASGAETLQNMALVALFTALVWAGAVIKINIWPVPLTLQVLGVLLLGLRLRPGLALQSILLYVILGAIGLPLFAGGKGGLAVLLGPSGGYLFGLVLQAFLLSLLCEAGRDGLLHGRCRRLFMAVALLLALTMPYVVGLPWLGFRLKWTLPETVVGGLLPFIPGDLIKGVVAWLLSPLLLLRRWESSALPQASRIGEKKSPSS